jgi:mannosyl-3-phosphoglycerate phosphatase family protein
MHKDNAYVSVRDQACSHAITGSASQYQCAITPVKGRNNIAPNWGFIMLTENILTTMGTQRLIFTDLDGSLLDHNTYSHKPAVSLLETLNQVGIPVILTSSKTMAEIVPLRAMISNSHPFIVENGAGIYVPMNYFSYLPSSWRENEGFMLYSRSPGRDLILEIIDTCSQEFRMEYQTFSHLFEREGSDGISRVTGLLPHQAESANKREFSETIIWLSTDSRKQQFIETLTSKGLSVQQGGRFLSVTDHASKGRALQYLTKIFKQQHHINLCDTLAIGDADNDKSMLEIADSALIIRSRHHMPPKLDRCERISISKEVGPKGWVSGVTSWLQNF